MKYFINITIFLFFICLIIGGFSYYTSKLMQRKISKSKKAIMKFELYCNDGTEEKIERWSKTGYSKGCYKNDKKHGRWVAWQGGYQHIEGWYINGKKHGEWKIYNKDGSIYRIISYTDDREVM